MIQREQARKSSIRIVFIGLALGIVVIFVKEVFPNLFAINGAAYASPDLDVWNWKDGSAMLIAALVTTFGLYRRATLPPNSN